MAGVLEHPSERGAVSGGRNSVVGGCDEPDVSGDCYGNDGAGCKLVANDTIRAIVGW